MIPRHRLEMKYVVPRTVAEAIADSVAPIADIDGHSDERGYTIHSLYYDTQLRTFFEMNATKAHYRFKPRVRYYGTKPGKRLFVELKRKTGDIVSEVRQRVKRKAWPQLLDTPGATAETFAGIVQAYAAEPAMHIRYRRRAFVSRLDDYARVTIDSELRCSPAHGSHTLEVPDAEMIPIRLPGMWGHERVVLELKCLAQVPSWMIGLVSRFNLRQRGFSKYCAGLVTAREVLGSSR